MRIENIDAAEVQAVDEVGIYLDAERLARNHHPILPRSRKIRNEQLYVLYLRSAQRIHSHTQQAEIVERTDAVGNQHFVFGRCVVDFDVRLSTGEKKVLESEFLAGNRFEIWIKM